MWAGLFYASSYTASRITWLLLADVSGRGAGDSDIANGILELTYVGTL